MPDMPIPTALAALLANPIHAKAANTDQDVAVFLGELQANILKSHGRHHTAQMFLSFKGLAPAAVARIVRSLGARCTSAGAQLRTRKSQPPYLDGGPVYCLFLSALGYKALGPMGKMPEGDAFRAGMAAPSSRVERSGPVPMELSWLARRSGGRDVPDRGCQPRQGHNRFSSRLKNGSTAPAPASW